MSSRTSDHTHQRLRTLVIVLATALIVAPTAAFATNSFSDVSNSDFFHDAVDWMADNDVTVGCNPPGNTRYCPNDNVTRGEMAVFLQRLDTKNVFLRPGEAADGVFAVVADGGTLVRGNGATTAMKSNTGSYHVVFDRDVSACSFMATIGRTGSVGVEPPGFITTAGLNNNEKGVYVTTDDTNGSASDRSFHLQVIC